MRGGEGERCAGYVEKRLRCGGMDVLRKASWGEKPDREFIAPWVSIAERACHCADQETLSGPDGRRLVEQAGLKVSLENLMTFPWVRERVDPGTIFLVAGKRYSPQDDARYMLRASGHARPRRALREGGAAASKPRLRPAVYSSNL